MVTHTQSFQPKHNPPNWKAFVASARSNMHRLLHGEMTGSVLLMLATVVALIWANSPWHESYFHLWETELSLSLGGAVLSLTLHQWINDGLMVIFFLAVGLEIKREVLVGKLSSLQSAMLPIAAALGGMLVPALIYTLFNWGGSGASGWGVPMATDIAFVIGVMILLGKRVPISLKVFVTALAIVDDIGAVLVIAVFYTDAIVWTGLLVAALFLALIVVLTRMDVRQFAVYAVLTGGVWLGMLYSGVHATIAGILVAMVVPAFPRITPDEFFDAEYTNLQILQTTQLTRTSMLVDERQMEAITDLEEACYEFEPVLVWLETKLHGYVAYLIIPLFALSNAGVALGHGLGSALASPVALGVMAGLVAGKQIGVTLFSWLAVRAGFASLPEGITWKQIYGMSWLTSIGFTMSLFVTELAFTDHALATDAKVGILTASLVAGVAGYLMLRYALLPEPD